MKRISRYDGRSLTTRDACLNGTERGLRRLHFLGLVHNGTTLSNAMFDEDADADIPTSCCLDFEIYRSIGESGMGRADVRVGNGVMRAFEFRCQVII